MIFGNHEKIKFANPRVKDKRALHIPSSLKSVRNETKRKYTLFQQLFVGLHLGGGGARDTAAAGH